VADPAVLGSRVPVRRVLRLRPWQGASRRLAPRLDWLPLCSLVGGMLVWEALGRLLDFPFFPPFSRVVQASLAMIREGEIVANLAASLTSLALGYTAAALAGVLLGALMGHYAQLEYFFDLYVQAFLAAPTLVYVPLLFALFGVSRASQVVVVFLYAFFVISASTMAGVRRVNPEWIEMARAFGASERQLFWRVTLPASLPLVLTGLRTGLGRAAKGMINGEMYIALIGLGALIRRYGGRFDAERVLGVLLVIILVTLLIMVVFGRVERYLLRWVDRWELHRASDDTA
jgi:NitT/TauT family transport system permease protein